MSWTNPDELVVANTGGVFVAPTGTALPDDPTEALDPAFFGLGYTTEDGVTFTVTPQVTDINAWQSRQAIRRELTAQELQAAFSLQQWNEETVVLAFGGGAITEPESGIFRYDFPAPGSALDERCIVIDGQDGARHIRIVLPRGNVTDAVATNWKRSEAALLPITFKALQPADGSSIGYVLFDDAVAFAAGS